MVGHDGRIDVVVVGGTVLVINNPNSANRLMWKSFWDSTAGREEGRDCNDYQNVTRPRILQSLTNTRIEPQESLPAQAVIHLVYLCPLAGTRCPEHSAQDAQQRHSTSTRASGAFLRHTVNGTGLLKGLQPWPTLGIFSAILGYKVTPGRRMVSIGCLWN